MATNTWIASSAGNASTDANWSLGHAPLTGEDVVFDGTSVNNCAWDIAGTTAIPNSITLASGYDGVVAQGAVDIGIGAGGYSQAAGTFTGRETKTVTCAGGLTVTNSPTITSGKIRLSLTGTGKTISNSIGLSLHSLYVTGSYTHDGAENIGTASAGETFISGSLATAKVLNIYKLDGLSVTGVLSGTGTLTLNVGVVQTISFGGGNISLAVLIQLRSNAADNRVIPLGASAVLGSTLTVNSAHASNTCTLDLAGRSLQCNGITIGTRGIVLGGEGVIRNYGSFDSSAGTWTPETCQYIQMGNGTVKLAAAQTFYDYLNAPGVTETLASNVTVSHEYGNGGIVIPGAFSVTASGTSYDLNTLPVENKIALSPVIHLGGKRFMRKLERVL